MEKKSDALAEIRLIHANGNEKDVKKYCFSYSKDVIKKNSDFFQSFWEDFELLLLCARYRPNYPL